MMHREKSASEIQSLAEYATKVQIVRDFTRGVAFGFRAGFYLYGRGGISKTYTVVEELESCERAFVVHNTRLSAKGLFQTLSQHPDAIHVLDDLESAVVDAQTSNLLRAALWSTRDEERVLTWNTAKTGRESLVFRGGIIMIGNLPLQRHPLLRALATRLDVYHMDVSDKQVRSQMLALADQGYTHSSRVIIEPEICLSIVDLIDEASREIDYSIDLRLLVKAYHHYLQWQANFSSTHYRDMIRIMVRESAVMLKHSQRTHESIEEVNKELRNELRRIIAETDIVSEQIDMYRVRCDRSRADFFRKKQQIEAREFDEFDETYVLNLYHFRMLLPKLAQLKSPPTTPSLGPISGYPNVAARLD